MGNKDYLLVFILLSGLFFYGAYTSLVEIDISPYNPGKLKTHSYHEFIENFDENTTDIVVKSNNTNQKGFFIIQAHSSYYNVCLTSYNNTSQTNEGHNIGMIQFFINAFTYSFNLEKLSSKNITILITVTVYNDSALAPGGCSESLNDTHISPIVELIDGQEIITMNVEPPSLKGFTCNDIKNETLVQVYHKFLPGRSFGTYDYYRGILTMLTVQDIQKNGRLVSSTRGHSNLKKIFSSYIGVGEVFAVIVTINETSSAYIPSISFGEDINILIENDKKGSSVSYLIFLSFLPVVALIVIYRGHTFFHFTTFLMGTSCGIIISLFMLNHDGSPIGNNTLIESFLLGLLYGLVWLGLWYKWGLPLLSPTFLHCGVFLSCTIYYLGIADREMFHSDGAYWSIFCGIIIAYWFILSVLSSFGHIFACAVLGSYVLILTTLNKVMNGNMQYIIINVYRRMYVRNFNEAILDPPYQPRDYFTSFIGICFTVHGMWKQLKNQVGEPSFPSREFRGERTPLL